MKGFARQLFFVVIILFALSAALSLVSQRLQKPEEVSLTQLAQEIREEKITRLVVEQNALKAERTEGRPATSHKEGGVSVLEIMERLGVEQEKLAKVEIVAQEPGGLRVWLPTILSILLPVLLIFGIFWFFMNRAQQSSLQAFSFGKVKAKIFSAREQKERVTFADVAGADEAKEELREVVEFLKYPQKFLNIGARIPRGVLLMGPPGSGKTLLARAVAGEANVPFFHISGSEFVEMFVGVGASRVRDLFDQAKKAAPAIVFIDEIDAVGRMRGAGLGGGHDEREQTLNQILVEMDGFDRTTNVIVTAATNRPDVLDPALLRPGRFDRRVILDQPDIKAREEILHIHVKDKKLAPDINVRAIAERTPGFSGADLANLVNEAAILAARRNKPAITQMELSESIDKVILGPERKSKVFSQKEKEIAAYHEAGHALIAASIPGADPVHKVSIVSRGMAGGYTQQLPTEDRRLHTKSEFLARLAVLLGGYVSEEVVFKELTTGAANDLRIATDLARKLVTEFGMSEALGPVVYAERQEMVFLGRELAEQRFHSEEVTKLIDKEIERVMQEARQRAKKILMAKRRLLEKIAKELITKETLEREEFEKIIGKKLPNGKKRTARV